MINARSWEDKKIREISPNKCITFLEYHQMHWTILCLFQIHNRNLRMCNDQLFRLFAQIFKLMGTFTYRLLFHQIWQFNLEANRMNPLCAWLMLSCLHMLTIKHIKRELCYFSIKISMFLGKKINLLDFETTFLFNKKYIVSASLRHLRNLVFCV